MHIAIVGRPLDSLASLLAYQLNANRNAQNTRRINQRGVWQGGGAGLEAILALVLV